MEIIKKKVNIMSPGFLEVIFFILASATILGFPSITSAGALEGLKISARIIIPALFPFTVISLFLVKSSALDFLSIKINKITNKLIKLDGNEFTVIVLSLLGGYPVGAKLAEGLYKTGKISLHRAKRLMRFAINPSPAFFITVVGINIFKNKEIGIILFASNLLSCLILSCFNSSKTLENASPQFKQKKHLSFSEAFVESVADGAKTILIISAFVTFFGAVAFALKSVISNPVIYGTICPVLEISFGATEFLKTGLPPYLFSFILSFGGISTICQVKQAAGIINLKFSFLVFYRIIHGIFSAIISFVLFKIFPIATETISNGVEIKPAALPLFWPSVFLIIFSALFLMFANKKTTV